MKIFRENRKKTPLGVTGSPSKPGRERFFGAFHRKKKPLKRQKAVSLAKISKKTNLSAGDYIEVPLRKATKNRP
jgi:hypothetical protein